MPILAQQIVLVLKLFLHIKIEVSYKSKHVKFLLTC